MPTATIASLRKETARLSEELDRRRSQRDNPALKEIAMDPANLLSLAGYSPDPWQADLLRSSDDRLLICASRQVGKSLLAGALALREALTCDGALVLLLSRSQRQSSELFRDKVMVLYNALGRPVGTVRESALQLELSNGSRVVSLPGRTDETLVGFSAVSLLIIDEAARCADSLYFATRPMLAVSGGKLVCLSSAYARCGFFFEEWSGGSERWRRQMVRATECDRIGRDFLDEELAAMGQRLFDREYNCEFMAADDAVFDPDAVDKAFSEDTEAWGPRLF
jgi:hypothetical protein